MRTQQLQRAYRIGATPGKRGASLAGQRLGQDEKTIHCIGKAESGGNPKGKTWIKVAQQTADRRSHNKPKSKCGAQHSESSGAFVWRSDIGDISSSGRDTCRSDTGDDSADKQPTERRRDGHKDVIQAEPEIGKQNDWPTAEAVRQDTLH